MPAGGFHRWKLAEKDVSIYADEDKLWGYILLGSVMTVIGDMNYDDVQKGKQINGDLSSENGTSMQSMASNGWGMKQQSFGWG